VEAPENATGGRGYIYIFNFYCFLFEKGMHQKTDSKVTERKTKAMGLFFR
jgi:hypothetical protein